MATNHILVPKFTDDLLIAKFQRIQEEVKASHFTANSNGSFIQVDIRTMKPQELIDKIAKSKSYVLQTASFSNHGVSFSFHRNPSDRASPAFDRFEISGQNQNSDSAIFLLKAGEAINKQFGIGKLGAKIVDSASDPATDYAAASQAALERMQETALKLSEDLVSSRKELDAVFNEKQRSSDEYYSQKLAALDEEHRKKLEEISQARQDLEKTRAELDDRNNTHVRREIRAKLKEQIHSKYMPRVVTEHTERLRRPIHIVCVLGLIVPGYASYFFGEELYTIATTKLDLWSMSGIFLVVRQIGLTFGFLALLAYYLRWMNRWFDISANADLELRRFDLDIDRASWVVETGLEWRKAEGGVIPTLLLSGLTRNLFAARNKEGRDELHPADYLSKAILGNAKGLKLSLPGMDVELDAKQIGKDARRLTAE